MSREVGCACGVYINQMQAPRFVSTEWGSVTNYSNLTSPISHLHTSHRRPHHPNRNTLDNCSDDRSFPIESLGRACTHSIGPRLAREQGDWER